MDSSRMKSIDEFRIDVGRADKGRAFVRVVHVPSGKERLIVGLNGVKPQEAANRLIRELQEEIDKI